MVLMIEPISKCIEKLKNEREYDAVIFMTPDGEKLNQKISNRISQFKNIIILYIKLTNSLVIWGNKSKF